MNIQKCFKVIKYSQLNPVNEKISYIYVNVFQAHLTGF